MRNCEVSKCQQLLPTSFSNSEVINKKNKNIIHVYNFKKKEREKEKQKGRTMKEDLM